MTHGQVGARLALLLLLAGCPPPIGTTAGAQQGIHPWGEPVCREPDATVLRNAAYDCCYSPSLFVSRWVAYLYTKTPPASLPRWTGPFVADPRLTEEAGPMPDDYRGAYRADLRGFDRGHLAPDAAIKAFGRTAQAETYYLTNIIPQYSRINRGVWADLEDAVRRWANEHDTTWVITGPLFFAGADTARIGTRQRIAVPHACFLIVARRPGPQTLALILPNRPEPVPRESVPSFLVSVDSIETATGLRFFPRLSAAEAAAAKTHTRTALWP